MLKLEIMSFPKQKNKVQFFSELFSDIFWDEMFFIEKSKRFFEIFKISDFLFFQNFQNSKTIFLRISYEKSILKKYVVNIQSEKTKQ